jgi:catechol 2,3-dioxygenase-like lactoylglutathione lyase family enzyme
MKVAFVASVSIITPDSARSRELFDNALGLSLESPPGDEYAFTESLDGCKHFGVWPLAQAAQACFGTDAWPTNRPIPQLSIEFDVESPEAVSDAASELESRGFVPLHTPRTEPWGQTIARIQSLEGAIVGISHTPSMHQKSDERG